MPTPVTDQPEIPRTRAAVTAATPDAVDPAHVVALAQLWADQFQHMTTLAVSAAGGLLILLQAGLVKAGPRWWVAVLLFAFTGLLGMIGQTAVVDEATRGIIPGRAARVIRALVLFAFGSGGWLFVRLFI